MRATRSLASCLALAAVSVASIGCGGAALLWFAVFGEPQIKYASYANDSRLDLRSIESASLDCHGLADLSKLARTLADELALHRDGHGPEVVGLHRLAALGSQTPGDSLEVIFAALEARGLRYELAAVQDNLDDPDLIESEALLVRSDIVWRDAVGGRIETGALAPDTGRPAFWVGCDLLLGDSLVRVVSTGPVGDAQAEISVVKSPSN